MTISTQTARAQYAGNGVTTSFAVPFEFLTATPPKVVYTNASGVDATWVVITNYTLTGGGADQPATGSITALIAPAVGTRITILRNEELTQLADYIPDDPFPAVAHEKALDRLSMQIQMIDEKADRAISFKESSTASDIHLPDPEAGKILGWNAAADALENKEPVSVGVAGVAGAIIFAADTPADVRDYLDVVVGTDVQAHSANLDELATVNPDTAGKDILAMGTATAVRDYIDPQAGKFQAPITGFATRTINAKEWDRMSLRDWNGLDLTDTNDNLSIMNAALLQSASEGKTLFVPSGVIALSNTVTWKEGSAWQGEGVIPAKGWNHYPKPLPADKQTWFHLSHLNVGFLANDGTNNMNKARCARNFGTFRDQNQPGVSAYGGPIAADFDIKVIAGNDIWIEDWNILNGTKGFQAIGNSGGGCGRLNFNRIMGQPVSIGMLFEHCMDIIRINNVNFFPFWVLNTELLKWQVSNAIALQMGRVDNPQVDNWFTYAYGIGAQFFQSSAIDAVLSPAGKTSHFQFGKFQADATRRGIIVETGTDAVTGHIDDYVAAGSVVASSFGSAAAEPRGLELKGTNAQISIDSCDIDYAPEDLIAIPGSGNQLQIGNGHFSRYNNNAVGAMKMIDVGSGSRVDILGKMKVDTAIANVFDGLGIAGVNAWRNYTATISAASGSITSATLNGSWFRRIGDTIDVVFDVSITTVGTGSGALRVSLPYQVAATTGVTGYCGVGRDLVGGKMQFLNSPPGTTRIDIIAHDSTSPIIAGARINGQITAQVA